jgi:putative pyridoxal-dependent aspartate 1-decarboxylase
MTGNGLGAGGTMADHSRSHTAVHAVVRRPIAPAFRELFVESTNGCDGSDWALREAVRSLSKRASIVPEWLPDDVGDRTRSIPEGDADPMRYFAQLADRVLPCAANVSSPRCLAHMTAMVPEFVHELTHVLLGTNQNLVKRDASSGFTVLERETLGMMHRLVFDLPASFYDEHEQDAESSLGMFCSGGTLANLTALWIARNQVFGRTLDGSEALGLPAAIERSGSRGAVIVGSELMHYSFRKAAGLLGIGEHNLRLVPADPSGRVRTQHCRRVIQQCVDSGLTVVALVGVAGTTDCGSIDPLDELADLAEEFRVHYHVDAAWGGALLFSRRHRERLSGIARAHSVTMDAHKQMCLPIGLSVLLLRNPHAARAIEKSTDYILRDGSDDLGRYSVEGSRPGTSLFVHAALHIIGRRGYESFVDDSIVRAAFMAAQLRRREEFELLAEPETNMVVYRYVPPHLEGHRAEGETSTCPQHALNLFNTALQQQQLRVSRTLVSRTVLRHLRYGEPVVALRAVLANPLTTEEDVCALLDDQTEIARALQHW